MTAITSKPRLITEDSTSTNMMNDYMRNIILSKVGNSDSRTPIIVQDNARSFASLHSHRNETMKITIGKNERKTASQISNLDADSSRWEPNKFPAHVANSNLCIQQRWSNGTTEPTKGSFSFDDRADKKRKFQKSLTASLARDLNITGKSRGSDVFSFLSDDGSDQAFSSDPTMYTSNPHHSLVRPERIPSSECFWNKPERRSLPLMNSSQPSSTPRALRGNYRWEPSSKQAPGKLTSLSNKTIVATPHA